MVLRRDVLHLWVLSPWLKFSLYKEYFRQNGSAVVIKWKSKLIGSSACHIMSTLLQMLVHTLELLINNYIIYDLYLCMDSTVSIGAWFNMNCHFWKCDVRHICVHLRLHQPQQMYTGCRSKQKKKLCYRKAIVLFELLSKIRTVC
jgi:hypothetical protein